MTVPIVISTHGWSPGSNWILSGPSTHHASRIGIFINNEATRKYNRGKMFKSSGDGLAIIGDDRETLTRACHCCFKADYKTYDGVLISTSFEPKVEAGQIAKTTILQQGSGDSTSEHDEQPSPVPDQNLRTCGNCGLVYYCNRVCQKKTWYHHHRRECATLARGKKMYNMARNIGEEADSNHPQIEGNVEEVEDTANKVADHEEPINTFRYNIFNNLVRMTIRFLLVFQTSLTANETTGPLDHLLLNLSPAPMIPGYDLEFRSVATLVREVTNTPFTQAQVEDWIRMLSKSRREMAIPIVKEPCQPPNVGSIYSPGYIVDPILSMIQHSCDPNAHIIIERGTIWVRALKDIPAGGEITFNYLTETESLDYHLQAALLDFRWEQNCACGICQKVPPIPDNEVDRFDEAVIQTSLHTMDRDLHSKETINWTLFWIIRLSHLGYGYGREYLPMARRLWYMRLSQLYHQKNYHGIMKACLRIYIWIDLGNVHDERRIDTLYFLCDLLNPELCDRRINVEGWSKIPVRVKCEFSGLYYCFREHYLKLLRQCYGYFSPIVQFEVESWNEYITQSKRMMGWGRRLTHEEAPEYIEEMRDSLNVLLMWTENPLLVDQSFCNELFGWPR
ncbi:hypothetical protein IFR05_004196 [Cadophora sp. M221]|nr:hypothetical protein IFR05_004196 [Cadophora sp. M221]